MMVEEVGVRPQRRLVDKFGLLVDLGTVQVPCDYVHSRFLGEFREKHSGNLDFINQNFTDENYSSPSTILRPGDSIWIRVFRQTCEETRFEERLRFLRIKGAVLLGAQGLVLAFEYLEKKAPKGYRHFSLDEKACLWRDRLRKPCLPGVEFRRDGTFVYLSQADQPMHRNHTLLVFSRESVD